MNPRKSVSVWLGGCLALLIAAAPAFAQSGTVTGTVTQAGTNSPLEGAVVEVVGANISALTRTGGRYLILNVPAGSQTIRVSFVGHGTFEQTVNIVAGERVTLDVSMQSEAIALNEIVVTGALGATPRAKLPFSVEQLRADDMPVPHVSAASAIQGKVAGATVMSGSGRPGSAPTILLRGPTSINASGRSQEPLYIVDGVILSDGVGMADIDASDIESIEIVKGAAAASLYGSRAANGVVQITTRRGREITDNQVQYTFRTEIGQNQLPGRFNLTQRHHFAMEGDKFVDASGNTCDWLQCANVTPAGQRALEGQSANSWNSIQREAWPGRTYDHVEEFFEQGLFRQSYISAMGRSGGTNFHASYTNVGEEGVMPGQEGFDRHTFRLNLDQTLSPNLEMSGSAFYSRSVQDDFGESQGNPMFNLTRMPAGVNLRGCVDDNSADCTVDSRDRLNRLIIRPDPFNENDNPLYTMLNRQSQTDRGRFLSSANLRWTPIDMFDLSANVSYDRLDFHREQYYPKGYRDTRNTTYTRDGALYKYNSLREGLNASVTGAFRFDLGNIGTNRTQLRYLWEQEDFEWYSADGFEFGVADLPNFYNINSDNFGSTSGVRAVRSDGYFLISHFDLLDRYNIDALVRNDGSSLFGPDNRRSWYYRLGGSWRVSAEDWFEVNGLNDLRVRYAIGTAGGRPTWAAQYETYNVSGGLPSPSVLGNKNLGPELTTEHEFGVDAVVFDRAMVTLNYASSVTTDQILPVPMAPYKGFSTQWQNAGTLESNTLEASLDLTLVQRPNFSWSARVLYDRTRQEITELHAPAFTYGVSGQNMGSVFYAREGEALGTFYGMQIATSCEHLPAGTSCDGFAVNDDGLLVWVGDAGSPNNGWDTFVDDDGNVRYYWGSDGPAVNGTVVKWGAPIQGYCTDRASGEQTDNCPVGKTMPDYKMSFSSTMAWGNLSLYGLFDAVQGVSVYNQPLQWAIFQSYGGIMDQSDRPEAEQKPVGYYEQLYGVSGLAPNSFFVQDASFVKLRELSLRYRVTRDQLAAVPGLSMFNGMTLNMTGRNLITWTNYDGYDPEVGRGGGTTGSAALARVDGYNYPNFRTVSFGIELNF